MCGEAGHKAGVTLGAQCIGGLRTRLSALKSSLVRALEGWVFFFFFSSFFGRGGGGRVGEREIVKTIWKKADQL